MAIQRLAIWDEVDDFLTSTPTPEQIIAFRLSEPTQERLSLLLEANRAGSISSNESAELDELLAIDTLMARLKIRAMKKLPTPG
ncbi:MAG: hypothetical protein JNJ61_19745 [Anaerolineae bacterium]|nr:hypothetical protein [Anaerolineae bacterium]